MKDNLSINVNNLGKRYYLHNNARSILSNIRKKLTSIGIDKKTTEEVVSIIAKKEEGIWKQAIRNLRELHERKTSKQCKTSCRRT